MFEQTKFVNNSFSLVFPRQPQIRRMANEFEDRLKERYFQPQIISVPDDLDPEGKQGHPRGCPCSYLPGGLWPATSCSSYASNGSSVVPTLAECS